MAKSQTRMIGYGCSGLGLLFVLAIIALLSWHYRLEEAVAQVSGDTGCTIDMTSNGGWESKVIAPGVSAEDVKYPLEIRIFATECAGIPGGKPYSAELIAPISGRTIARGLECGSAPASDYPCRLDVPPLYRTNSRDFIVRVVRAKGEAPREARVRVVLKREWRSALIDALMSV